MVDYSQSAGLSSMFTPLQVRDGVESLRDRRDLLHELTVIRDTKLRGQQDYLIVINIADTKNYDEIIRVFGYKFAEDLLSIRLDDLDFVRARGPVFHIGFWSIGLIFHARDQEDYETTLARLNATLARPLICRGIPVSIKAGVGVCDIAKGLGSAEDLLQATFLAGQAGAATPAGWAECNYDMADDHRRAFTLISHAGASLETPHEFQLTYQARVDLRTGYCDTTEAFLRWSHPTLGPVMPDEFIPLIETTGLIRDLTNWVISYALAQAAFWRDCGHNLRTCVKISSKNLDEIDFVPRVAALLETHKIAPAMLELEFSEKRAFSDIAVARERMKQLRNLGVNISLDDFGTGANTFSSLENIPANVIKLDRHHVNSLLDNPRQQALVKSIIRMAHELNMQVVAEGVETPAVLEMLVTWRCDYAEGYLFNRPMPAEAFIEWFAHTFPRNKPSAPKW